MSKLVRDLSQLEQLDGARREALQRAASAAAEEQTARERMALNGRAIDDFKTREMAEAEAAALAKIRAQTERSLAAQAEALREAERKAELAAIERQTAELEATREAKRREGLDHEARAAAESRTAAERQLETAARERAEAAAAATASAESRRQAEIEQKSALAARRRAQWAAFWAGARPKPVLAIGSLMLLLGAAGGLWATGNLRLPRLLPAAGELPELRLRLDDDASAIGQRVQQLPPRREARLRGR